MNSPRFAPAGLLVEHSSHRVMLDGGPGAEPDGELSAWLVTDDRGEFIRDLCRLARARGLKPVVGAYPRGLVNNLPELAELVGRHDWEAWRTLVYHAARHGLQAELEGRPVAPLVRELVDIAQRGLASRGHGEEAFLHPLHQRLIEGQCPADKALAALARGRATLLEYATYDTHA
jgi:hypothetical protein